MGTNRQYLYVAEKLKDNWQYIDIESASEIVRNLYQKNDLISSSSDFGKYKIFINSLGVSFAKKGIHLLKDLGAYYLTDKIDEPVKVAVKGSYYPEWKEPVSFGKKGIVLSINSDNENTITLLNQDTFLAYRRLGFLETGELVWCDIKKGMVHIPTGDYVNVNGLLFDRNGKITQAYIQDRIEFKLPYSNIVVGANPQFNANGKVIWLQVVEATTIILKDGKKINVDDRNSIKMDKDGNEIIEVMKR